MAGLKLSAACEIRCDAMGTFVGHIGPGAAFIVLGVYYTYLAIVYPNIPSSSSTTVESTNNFMYAHKKETALKFIFCLGIIVGELSADNFAIFHDSAFDRPWIRVVYLHNTMSFAIFSSAILEMLNGRGLVPAFAGHVAMQFAFFFSFVLFLMHSLNQEGLERRLHELLASIYLFIAISFALQLRQPFSATLQLAKALLIQCLGGYFLWIGYVVYKADWMEKTMSVASTFSAVAYVSMLFSAMFVWLLCFRRVAGDEVNEVIHHASSSSSSSSRVKYALVNTRDSIEEKYSSERPMEGDNDPRFTL